jgi:hypothetical protein
MLMMAKDLCGVKGRTSPVQTARLFEGSIADSQFLGPTPLAQKNKEFFWAYPGMLLIIKDRK